MTSTGTSSSSQQGGGEDQPSPNLPPTSGEEAETAYQGEAPKSRGEKGTPVIGPLRTYRRREHRVLCQGPNRELPPLRTSRRRHLRPLREGPFANREETANPSGSTEAQAQGTAPPHPATNAGLGCNRSSQAVQFTTGRTRTNPARTGSAGHKQSRKQWQQTEPS